MPKTFRERVKHSIAEAESRLVNFEELDQTMQYLVREGAISEQTAHALRSMMPSQIQDSRYILRNLGAHLAIGVVFAFDVVPLPLGTIARISWVAGNRLLEELRQSRNRARVHSVGVFALAAIPWFGYAAYLLPLRRQSAELAFVLANHSWLDRTGRSYEKFLDETNAPLRRFGRWLIPRPAPRTVPPSL